MKIILCLALICIAAIATVSHACISDDLAERRTGEVSIVTNYTFSRNQSRNEENLNNIGRKFISLIKSLNTSLERIRFRHFYNNKGYLAVLLTQKQFGAKGCKKLVELTKKAIDSIYQLISAKVHCGRGKLFVIKKRTGSTTGSETSNYNSTTRAQPSSSTTSSQPNSYSRTSFATSSTFTAPNSASTNVANSLALNNTI